MGEKKLEPQGKKPFVMDRQHKLFQIRVHLEAYSESCAPRFLYFLLDGYEVVYVGQTKNIVQRIQSHRKDKIFDGVQFLRMPPRFHPLVLESAFIKKMNPKLNRVVGSGLFSDEEVQVLKYYKMGKPEWAQ